MCLPHTLAQNRVGLLHQFTDARQRALHPFIARGQNERELVSNALDARKWLPQIVSQRRHEILRSLANFRWECGRVRHENVAFIARGSVGVKLPQRAEEERLRASMENQDSRAGKYRERARERKQGRACRDDGGHRLKSRENPQKVGDASRRATP